MKKTKIEKSKWHHVSHSICCNKPIEEKQIEKNDGVCPFCGNDKSSIFSTRNVVTRRVKTKKRFLFFFWRTIHERLEYIDDLNKDEYEKEEL